MVREILLLGDERLYQPSRAVAASKISTLDGLVRDLHDTLMDYRARQGAGRAIAAPQIGAFVRVIYMHVGQPTVLVNPQIEFLDEERMTLLDDCMSFPGLLVRVQRYKRCTLRFADLNGAAQQLELEGDLSELLQHEYDHLDGILATQRAVDDKAFVMGALRR